MEEQKQNVEKKVRRRKLIKSVILLLLCAAVVAWWKELFRAQTVTDALGILSDVFFVPGALFAGVGGLSWIAHKGGYDAFGYVFRNFSLHNIFPSRQKDRVESYYDYKQKKDEKGRPWLPHVLVTGLCSVALAGIMLILYALV